MPLTVLVDGTLGTSDVSCDHPTLGDAVCLMVAATRFVSLEFAEKRWHEFHCRLIEALVREVSTLHDTAGIESEVSVPADDQHIVVGGEKMALSDALRLNGISKKLFRWRVRSGWTIERAASTKPNARASDKAKRSRVHRLRGTQSQGVVHVG